MKLHRFVTGHDHFIQLMCSFTKLNSLHVSDIGLLFEKQDYDTATACTVQKEKTGFHSRRRTEPLFRDQINSFQITENTLCTLRLSHLTARPASSFFFLRLSSSGTGSQRKDKSASGLFLNERGYSEMEHKHTGGRMVLHQEPTLC